MVTGLGGGSRGSSGGQPFDLLHAAGFSPYWWHKQFQGVSECLHTFPSLSWDLCSYSRPSLPPSGPLFWPRAALVSAETDQVWKCLYEPMVLSIMELRVHCLPPLPSLLLFPAVAMFFLGTYVGNALPPLPPSFPLSFP